MNALQNARLFAIALFVSCVLPAHAADEAPVDALALTSIAPHAVIMDYETGALMLSQAGDQEMAPASMAKLVWRPQNTVGVEGDAAESLVKLLDALDAEDDVQNVYSNEDISDEDMEKYAG